MKHSNDYSAGRLIGLESSVSMPTIARVGEYRFFFYSNEGDEAPHVHVQAGRRVAKYWLDPVALARSIGFRSHELTRLERLINERRAAFMEEWSEFFGK